MEGPCSKSTKGFKMVKAEQSTNQGEKFEHGTLCDCTGRMLIQPAQMGHTSNETGKRDGMWHRHLTVAEMKLRWSLYFPEGQVDLPAVNTGIRLERGQRKLSRHWKMKHRGLQKSNQLVRKPFPWKCANSLWGERQQAASQSTQRAVQSLIYAAACPPAASLPTQLLFA